MFDAVRNAASEHFDRIKEIAFTVATTAFPVLKGLQYIEAAKALSTGSAHFSGVLYHADHLIGHARDELRLLDSLLSGSALGEVRSMRSHARGLFSPFIDGAGAQLINIRSLAKPASEAVDDVLAKLERVVDELAEAARKTKSAVGLVQTWREHVEQSARSCSRSAGPSSSRPSSKLPPNSRYLKKMLRFNETQKE